MRDRTPPPLTTIIRHDLVHALYRGRRVPDLPDELHAALASAIEAYRDITHRDRSGIEARRYAAVEAIEQAAMALRVTMAKADQVWEPCASNMFIPHAWQSRAPALDALLQDVRAWLPQRGPRKRGKGNPHTGRQALRLAVLGALADAGIALPARNARGPAGRALGIMLALADTLDGKPARTRFNISSDEWARWIKSYRAVEDDMADILQQGRRKS